MLHVIISVQFSFENLTDDVVFLKVPINQNFVHGLKMSHRIFNGSCLCDLN